MKCEQVFSGARRLFTPARPPTRTRRCPHRCAAPFRRCNVQRKPYVRVGEGAGWHAQ